MQSLFTKILEESAQEALLFTSPSAGQRAGGAPKDQQGIGREALLNARTQVPEGQIQIFTYGSAGHDRETRVGSYVKMHPG